MFWKTLVIGAFVVLPSQGLAHPTPIEYSPAASAVFDAAPDVIRIRFNERIEPRASGIRIFGPDGSAISLDKVNVSEHRVVTVPFKATDEGTYTVSWQVLSADDGHSTTGAFVFSVGSESATALPNQLQIEHRSGWDEALMIALELLGQAMLLGALALLWAVWRPLKHGEDAHAASSFLHRRLRTFIAAALLLVLIGTLGYLLLKSINLAADRDGTFVDAFRAFILTVAGRHAVYRLVLGALISVLFLLSLRGLIASNRFEARALSLLTLLCVLFALRARVSHAAAAEFLPMFSIMINAVHLFFKNLWIGGLFALVFVFIPALRKMKDGYALPTLFRFSNMITWALAIGGMTGAYIVWLHLKGIVNLTMTHWGGYAIALTAYAALLLVLRLYQQIVVLPALSHVARGTADHVEKETARTAGALLIMETLTAVTVLLFSGMLIITTPPLSNGQLYKQIDDNIVGSIQFEEHPFEDDAFLVTVTRKAKTSTGSTLAVRLKNDEKDIGPILMQAEPRFPGGFVFPKATLSPPGTWIVDMTEQRKGKYDFMGRFVVRYPQDVDAVHRTQINTFGIFMILVAGCILGLSWYVRRENDRQFRLLPAHGGHDEGFLNAKKPWLIIPLCVLILIAVGFGFANHSRHGNSGLRDACIAANGQWLENVPMRAGRIASQVPVLGCSFMTKDGPFHLADPREGMLLIQSVAAQ